MAKSAEIKVELTFKKFCIIFFPIATYTVSGDISLLTVFGLPVYRRVGDIKSILGYSFGTEA